MDEQAKEEAVAAIVSRHVESLKRDLRQTIALRLLDENGSVSAEDVAERFTAEWSPPDPQTLAHVVAKKTAAAVEFHRREVEWENRVVDLAGEKLAKVEERHAAQLAAARADLDAAESSAAPEEATARLREAEELAAFAGARGDASKAPPPRSTSAKAEAATGKRSA